MPSLVPGFEYDIFISYRQKDNKYDGWVTEFVNNLKKELEAAFKEDISIYFDINPHDGLAAHHVVEDSLRAKLKSILLIPIVSRTYCDVKSYAWENELRLFVSQASADNLGLKVKLPGTNVAGRILPICIHELDPQDIKLFETETKTVFRPIDFVFKTAGVNRPLLPADKKEDSPNHLLYRDQINKVANAIREIILAAKGSNPEASSDSSNLTELRMSGRIRHRKSRLIIGGVALLLLLAMGYFFNPMSSEVRKTDSSNYDLAVMYLEDFTENKFGDELANLIYINLSEDTSIHVVSRQVLYDEMRVATGNATSPDPAHASEIARKLGVKTMLTGSIHQSGQRALVQLELIEASSGKKLRSEKLEGDVGQIFQLANSISSRMSISSIERKFNVTTRTTSNYNAYKVYYDGLESFYGFRFGEAAKKFQAAIQMDSTFALAYLYLALSDLPNIADVTKDMNPAISLIRKAAQYSSRLNESEQELIAGYLTLTDGSDHQKANDIGRKLYKANPGDRGGFALAAWASVTVNPRSFLPFLEEYVKLHPTSGLELNQAAYIYGFLGDRDKALDYVERYVQSEPLNSNTYHSGWEVALQVNEPELALQYLDKREKVSAKNQYFWRGLQGLAVNDPALVIKIVDQFKDSTSSQSFAEMLPSAMIIQGKFADALTVFDKQDMRYSRDKNRPAALKTRLHKGMIFIARHQSEKSSNLFDELSAAASREHAGQYTPYPFLALFYRGVAEIDDGKFKAAAKTLDELKIKRDAYGEQGWRFNKYLCILEMMVSLTTNNQSKADTAIGMMDSWFGTQPPTSIRAMSDYYWKKGEHNKALNVILPFDKNILRSREYNGGDQIWFAIERAFADYKAGRIHEDAGNKNEAVKYYTQFLKSFSQSDSGIPEKIDAEKRLKALK